MRLSMHLEDPPVDTLRYPPESGASGRNRTSDTGIFSPLLYQLSYRGKSKTGLFPATACVILPSSGRNVNSLFVQNIDWPIPGML